MQHLLILGLDDLHPLGGRLWTNSLVPELSSQFQGVHIGELPAGADQDLHVLAVGWRGLYAYMSNQPALGTRCTYYHIQPFQSWIPPAGSIDLRVVAPTQALAEDVGPILNRSVRVVPVGDCGLRQYDLALREPGPEELRPLLWPTVPPGERLYGLPVDPGWDSHTLSAVFAVFGQLVDRLDWRLLVLGGDRAAPTIDRLVVLNGLEDRMTRAAWPTAARVQDVLNALDLLICPPGATVVYEPAMACGCLPVVVDDARWAERVDGGRGVACPGFSLGDEVPVTLFDPTGTAQILRQIDRPELFIRRSNCAAWASSADSSPATIGALWRQILV